MAKILIVDDEPDIRKITAVLVVMCGHEAVPADGGMSGLDLLDPSVDLIFADVQMPGIDGHQFARLAHAKHPLIPLVMMSGAPLECRDCPRTMCDLLWKPFNLRQLRDKIEATLSIS